MENRNNIVTMINDQLYEIEGERAFMPLAAFLRQEANLTGTKVVCAEGDCGACTVLLARTVGSDGKLIFKSVNSCILPLYLIDRAQVVTVEGVKKSEAELHPVQQAMVDCQGSQCGYCTPGFICAMTGMVEKLKSENKEITEKRSKNFLTGNLCRCTGYKPIIEAAMSIDLTKTLLLKDRFYNPLWIAEMKKNRMTPIHISFNDKHVKRNIFIPVSLDQALREKSSVEGLRIVGGATDLGVLENKGRSTILKAMTLCHIEELKKISHDLNFIFVGGTVTLSEFEDYIENFIPELKNILHLFASPQIKNQASLVGNIVNGSPIADTIPFLMVSDSKVVLQSTRGTREVLISDFYMGYKVIDLKPDEIVISVKIPRLKTNQQLRLYKVSMRKDLDISAVTFAGIVEVKKDNTIADARFCLGGVAASVLRLNDIEAKIIGESFSINTFKAITNGLPLIVFPLSDLRASKEYRMKLAQNFFLKFYNEISKGVLS